MENIKNAKDYVTDKATSTAYAASKEAHKQIAQDPNQGLADRLNAAGNALQDKVNEVKYDTTAEAHKNEVTK